MRRLIILGLLAIGLPAMGQVFNCSSGFVSANTTCGVGLNGTGGYQFQFASAPSGVISGTAAELIPGSGGGGHSGSGLIYQTVVNAQAFSSNFTFQSNGKNIAFVLTNNTSSAGNNPGYFSSGAGCEGGFNQAFTSGAPPVNKVFALELDQFSPLTNSGSFTYSSAQIYQQVESPCQPPYTSGNGTSYGTTFAPAKLSTAPLAMNSPASTALSCVQTVGGTCDTFSATIGYDGTNVNLCLYDVTAANGSCSSATSGTGTYFQKTWNTINIPSLLGSNTGYVGIVGGTNSDAVGNLLIKTFSYTVNPAPSTPSFSTWTTQPASGIGSSFSPTPAFSPAAGTYSATQSVTITSAGASSICYSLVSSLTSTTLLPQPDSFGGCTVGTLYTGAVSVPSSTTLYAMATTGTNTAAAGMPSALGSAAYTINAGNYNVNSSMTVSQISSIAATAAGGSHQVMQFAAGTYPAGSYTMPCTNGVIYQGVPITEPNISNLPTVIIPGRGDGLSSFNVPSNGSSYTSHGSGCTFRYFQFSGGGGGLYFSYPSSGMTVQYNYFTLNDGVPSCTGACASGPTAGSGGTSTAVASIYFNGNCPGGGGPVQACAAAQGVSYPEVDSNVFYNNCRSIRNVGYDAGALCSAVWHQGYNGHQILTNNIVNGTEEGFKWNLVYYQINNVMASIDVENNQMQNFSRIAMETQQNTDGNAIFSHNSYVNPGGGLSVAPYFATFALSIPINTTNPAAVTNDNIVPTGAVSGNHYGVGWEVGGQGMNGQYNVFIGSNTCGSHTDYDWIVTMFSNNAGQSWTNNYFSGCNFYGGSPNNVTNAFRTEAGAVLGNATLTPNTVVQTSGNVQTATPTISPASGSGGQTVTLSDTDSVHRNVTIFYTTDGSTPMVFPYGGGAGNTHVYSGPFSVGGSTTVKALAYWGIGANQGISFAPYLGWIPSAVTTVTYGGSSPGQVNTPVIAPPSQSFTTSLSISITDSTPSSTIYYTTDGSTPTTSSTVYTGAFSITATTTVNAIAAAAGLTNSLVGTAMYTIGVLPPPTLTSCYQGNAGSIVSLTVGGGGVQQTGFCTYASVPVTYQCYPTKDQNNNTMTFGSSNSAIVNVTSTGLATGVGAGNANSTAVATGGVQCNPWTFQVTNAPPSSSSFDCTGGCTVKGKFTITP